MRRRLVLFALVVALLTTALVAIGLSNARADPVVRRAAIALPGWPAGSALVTVALLSDIHLGSMAMDAGRLRRIVAQVQALHPDLILLAGDFIDGRGPVRAERHRAALATALARLHAPLGVVAVLGNHDYWTDPASVRAALDRAGVTVLTNAAAVRGPLVIGGVDDEHTRHADLPATLAAMRGLPGARLLLSHTPDVAADAPADVTLILAGHTHCGQIVLPLIGPPVEPMRTGPHYLCGIVPEGARRTVVGAGLGTSDLPLRFGAPPDLWLLTLGPGAGKAGA